MERSIFHKLGGGIAFNRKKYGGVMDRFEMGHNSVSKDNPQALQVAAPAASLDFFKTPAPGTHPQPKAKQTPKKKNEKKEKKEKREKKAKRGHVVVEEPEHTSEGEEDAGGVALFSNTSVQRDEDVGGSDGEEEGGEPQMTPEELHARHVRRVRRKARLHVQGNDVPEPIESFADLDAHGLHPFLARNIADAHYTTPSAIQMQAIPALLAGRELLACAPTGSGKTAAFLLPILQKLKGPAKAPFRALVLAPTRELAQQIHREVQKLCKGKKFRTCVLTKSTASTKNMLHGGSQARFDILVSTPLRLVNMVREGVIDLSNVRFLVFDEADRLFDTNFVEQVDEVIAACSHKDIQRALFSATMLPIVEELARSVLRDPVRIIVGEKNSTASTVEQELKYVGDEEGKMMAVRQIIQAGIEPPVIVFVQSKERAKELFYELVFDNIHVDVIHADRTKQQREAIVNNFRRGKIWVLIATDLMSRGMDFKGVSCVINYDFPQSVISYIHRIGRTGRAGRRGRAITLFTEDDADYLRSIANVMKVSGCDVPKWMLSLRRADRKRRKLIKVKPLTRKHISTQSNYDKRRAAHKRQMIEQSKKKNKGGGGKRKRAEKED